MEQTYMTKTIPMEKLLIVHSQHNYNGQFLHLHHLVIMMSMSQEKIKKAKLFYAYMLKWIFNENIQLNNLFLIVIIVILMLIYV
jgi:hypothetical protein